MATSLIDWQNVREQLAARRRKLFDCFEENPENIRLAVEIKRLDDELLVCTDHIASNRKRGEHKKRGIEEALKRAHLETDAAEAGDSRMPGLARGKVSGRRGF